jgi:hypothetical protein
VRRPRGGELFLHDTKVSEVAECVSKAFFYVWSDVSELFLAKHPMGASEETQTRMISKSGSEFHVYDGRKQILPL